VCEDWPQRLSRLARTATSRKHDREIELARLASESLLLLYGKVYARATVEVPLTTLLITSARSHDGKTTVAANLAEVAATVGNTVLLVDGDLRQPTLHTLFGVQGELGLSSLLADEELTLASAIVETGVDRVRLLPGGEASPTVGELWGTLTMRRRLAEMREQADLVIIDSPPLLGTSDPILIARLVDGVVLVIDPRRSLRRDVARAAALVRSTGVRVLGAVLNRAPLDHTFTRDSYGEVLQGNERSASVCLRPQIDRSTGVPQRLEDEPVLRRPRGPKPQPAETHLP
jgi:capsular exopolysaccharide synthesis family protein